MAGSVGHCPHWGWALHLPFVCSRVWMPVHACVNGRVPACVCVSFVCACEYLCAQVCVPVHSSVAMHLGGVSECAYVLSLPCVCLSSMCVSVLVSFCGVWGSVCMCEGTNKGAVTAILRSPVITQKGMWNKVAHWVINIKARALDDK